jgi:hypothetical protein
MSEADVKEQASRQSQEPDVREWNSSFSLIKCCFDRARKIFIDFEKEKKREYEFEQLLHTDDRGNVN